MNKTDLLKFQEVVWGHYHEHGRDLPWRIAEPDGAYDPYKILVSEIMLQQTQAARVIPKYHEFLKQFPSVESLAQSSLADVISSWSGLGYNRRAKFLHEAAKFIVTQHKGEFPKTLNELIALPGVGRNTAGAVLAYAFNQPASFIETNIRTIYIHHFFKDRSDVSDSEIIDLVTKSLPTDPSKNREWYWALMDYGVFLKSTIGNASRASKHYTKQSRFNGSNRQIRGQVIKLLTQHPHSVTQLKEAIDDRRLSMVLQDLQNESLIQQTGSQFHL